jgi:ornithine cyclodeaminase/alanine dehydrogenase-like protein (mu-crystallin family)
MPLLINNDVAARVLRISDAVVVVESALRQLAEGNAAFQPRTDFWSPKVAVGDFFRWGSLIGMIADPPTFALRFKSDIMEWKGSGESATEKWFNMQPGRYCGFIILIDTRNGEIIGLLNDGVIQHARVGANAAVGVKYLSREDSYVLGMLGSGGMARSYAEAICAVRPIREIQVFSPTPGNREKFADEMAQKLGVSARAMDSPHSAVKNADIVATCTDSRRPVFTADMIELVRPGPFIVRTRREEIDDAARKLIDRVVINSREGFGEFVIGSEAERNRRPMNPEYRRAYSAHGAHDRLADILVGKAVGRTSPRQSIYYENQSSGIQFAAVGRLVYEKAKAAGLGVPIPMEWFQQDIRN